MWTRDKHGDLPRKFPFLSISSAQVSLLNTASHFLSVEERIWCWGLTEPSWVQAASLKQRIFPMLILQNFVLIYLKPTINYFNKKQNSHLVCEIEHIRFRCCIYRSYLLLKYAPSLLNKWLVSKQGPDFSLRAHLSNGCSNSLLLAYLE